MKIRELLKGLSDEISGNKDFFKEFFALNIDEGFLFSPFFF